jgi:dienelactone hydrolase
LTRIGRRVFGALLLALAGAVALAQPALDADASRITLPLADGSAISAHWFALEGDAPRPAVVALHGCGGLWDGKTDRFEQRYIDYVARLHAAGFHVLLPDSFSARGERSICLQKARARSITVQMRRTDVAAAVRWLAAQPQVDAARIVLLGWSHGATTTLTAINAARSDAVRPVAAAVVFYPGCSALRQQQFVLTQPLLMLLGAEDDWTPAAHCEALIERVRERQPQADVTLRVYPGSHHGFDGAKPVRFRPGVPNGMDPKGVHSGGNPAARDAALAELDRFLQRIRQ